MSKLREITIACLVLCTSIVLVYEHVGTFEYLSWDDYYFIRDDPVVISGTPIDILHTVKYGNYAPAATLSFQIERRLFGTNPGEAHIVNVLLHVLNTLLVFFLLLQLVKNPWVALAVAMIFAVHPRSVEAVAWLSARKHLLAGAGIWGGMLAYLHYIDRKKIVWYGVLFGCFALGVFSTPAGALFPFAALAIRYFHCRRRDMPWELLPLLPLSIAGAGIASAVGGPLSVSWPMRLMFAGKSIFAHLLALFIPVPLSVLHLQTSPVTFASPDILIGIGLFLLTAILGWRHRKTWPVLAGGLSIFVLFLIPTLFVFEKKSGIILFQDRYLYIAMVGLLWIIADLLARMFRNVSRQNHMIMRMTMFMIICMIMTFGFLASRRTQDWHDNMRFYSAELKMHPDAPYLHLGLGYALEDQGNLKGAIAEYRSVVATHPEIELAKRLLAAATKPHIENVQLDIHEPMYRK